MEAVGRVKEDEKHAGRRGGRKETLESQVGEVKGNEGGSWILVRQTPSRKKLKKGMLSWEDESHCVPAKIRGVRKRGW